MEPLERVPDHEFLAAGQKYLAERCEVKDNRIVCKACGSTIEEFMVALTVHHQIPGFPDCSGSGQVIGLPVPYCPTCEGPPRKRSSCIHVP